MSNRLGVTDAEDAIGLNVTESLLDYLSGRNGATYPLSAGTILGSAGTAQRWNQLFAAAADPRVAGLDVGIDDIVRQASPLLMVTPAMTAGQSKLQGGMKGFQDYTIEVLLYARQWRTESGDRLDHRATLRQFTTAQNALQRLLQSANGNIRLWDFTQSTAALVHADNIGFIHFRERAIIATTAMDRYEAVWRLTLTAQVQAD